MKTKEMEKIFEGCVENHIVSKDGYKMIMYSKKPLSTEEIKYLEDFTSVEIMFLLTSTRNFIKHKIDDLPNNYGEN